MPASGSISIRGRRACSVAAAICRAGAAAERAARRRRRRRRCRPDRAPSPSPVHSKFSWNELSTDFVAAARELHDRGFRKSFAAADGRTIHNAGGSEAQELSFAIASAVEYLRAFEKDGISPDIARDMIYFRISADADEFLTIAKFRALRKLWTRVEEASELTPKPAYLCRGNCMANDDQTRSQCEHVAHNDRSYRCNIWRRRQYYGAASHYSDWVARCIRASTCSQHTTYSS